MSLLIIPGKFNPEVWKKSFLALDPNLQIEIWPEVKNPDQVEFAVVWRYPQGELLNYKNLKCISSLGAGVDHIFQDPKRPQNIPVVRIVDEWLIRDMTQYIVWATLNYLRDFDRYLAAEKQHQWLSYQHKAPPTVGIMGLGQLGSDAAIKLRDLGVNVISWSQTPKSITGITSFAGNNQFAIFLQQTQILICLLPLTSATQNILNKATFYLLPKDAYIINAARGEHVVDEDLITAIDNGQLAGACLDVFRTEPLPPEHPFWSHPKIRVTPHAASVTNPDSAAAQVVANYHRVMAGEPLLNSVDLERGY